MIKSMQNYCVQHDQSNEGDLSSQTVYEQGNPRMAVAGVHAEDRKWCREFRNQVIKQ